MKEKMNDLIKQYSSSDFYKQGNIPQKKHEAAVQNYPVPKHETMIGLVDATVFGSAKVGMAIGLQGVYWRNDWATETTKNYLSWGEMAKSTQAISAKSSKLLLGNGCVFDMTGSSMKAAHLAELLNKLVSLYRHEPKELTQNTNTLPQLTKKTSSSLAEKLLDNPEWAWDYENMYVRPYIPSEKLLAAISGYAPSVNPNEVLVLVDDTFFGSASDGLLITKDGIYANGKCGRNEAIFLESPVIEVNTNCRIMINGREFFQGKILDHLALLTLTYRLKGVLDKGRVLEGESVSLMKSDSNELESSKKDDLLQEFLLLHTQSLDAIREIQAEDFHFDTLVDEQIKIITDNMADIKKSVSKANNINNEKDLLAPTIEACLVLFMVIHNYSLSKLPRDFLDGFDNEDSLLQRITFLYINDFSEKLDRLHGKKLDDEFIVMISMIFFDKDATEKFNLTMPKEELLSGFLDKVNILPPVARNMIYRFDISVKKWYQNLIQLYLNDSKK
jgi:hypothetical protein